MLGNKCSYGVLLVTWVVSASLQAGNLHSDHGPEKEIAFCGHAEFESMDLREEAAEKLVWRSRDNQSSPESWVRSKILGFNDFHGQLEARTLFGRPAGGAEILAAYLRAEDAETENGALLVHAGDHVGASPPASALLHDEPSISFLNLLANKYCRYKGNTHPKCNVTGTLGNHEFDEGLDEMLRLIQGGIHQDGPFLGENFAGAKFPYINANVIDNNGKTILPPYVLKRVDNIPVAFIGAVLRETPNIVTPSGVAGLQFIDEAEAINSYIPELKRRGVRAIVVTIHQGARQTFSSGSTPEEAQELGGAIGDIVRRLDDEIDIVITGHAHGFTNQLVENNNGKNILVTQAFARGTAYADIDIALDPLSRDIVEMSASIITTFGDVGPGLTPQDDVGALVDDAVAEVAPLVDRVVGRAEIDILRSANAAGESALGNLIADAQRHAMGADIAFMNSGGIRADISAGDVSWGDLFTVQPFNNDLVKMELSGQDIVDLLNQQWDGQPYPRIMKPSGLHYSWEGSEGIEDRVIPESIRVAGEPIDLNASYTVVVNSFMAGGGDGFSVLLDGENRVVGPVDIDALVDYVESLPRPFSYGIEGRINRDH